MGILCITADLDQDQQNYQNPENKTKLINENFHPKTIIIFSQQHKKDFPLQNGFIGSSKDCQIVLQDDRISKKHLEIYQIESDGFFMRDIGSSNGTYVLLEPKFMLILRRNMEIMVGDNIYYVVDITDLEITFRYFKEGENYSQNNQLIITFNGNSKSSKCLIEFQISHEEAILHDEFQDYIEMNRKLEFRLTNHSNTR